MCQQGACIVRWRDGSRPCNVRTMNVFQPNPRYKAYHEAGHAVAGHISGFHIVRATIDLGPDSAGGGTVEWAELNERPLRLNTDTGPEWLRMYASGQAAHEYILAIEHGSLSDTDPLKA